MEQARDQWWFAWLFHCLLLAWIVARLGRYWDLSCYNISSLIPEHTSSDVLIEPVQWMQLIDKELVMTIMLRLLLGKNMSGSSVPHWYACMTPNTSPQILLALWHIGPKSIIRTMFELLYLHVQNFTKINELIYSRVLDCKIVQPFLIVKECPYPSYA